MAHRVQRAVPGGQYPERQFLDPGEGHGLLHVAVGAGIEDDEHLAEASRVLAQVIPASRVRQAGPGATADAVLRTVAASDLDGYWLHLDVDILDPEVMPAVEGGYLHQTRRYLFFHPAPAQPPRGEVGISDVQLPASAPAASLAGPPRLHHRVPASIFSTESSQAASARRRASSHRAATAANGV